MSSTSTECQDSNCDDSENASSESEREYYNNQIRVQDSFWRTTIEELKDHIQSLEAQKVETEDSINNTESTLLPCMTYLMIQLSTNNPKLDLNSLLSSEIIASCSNASLYADIPAPDLSMLECFTIQDNDVLYMDMIKAYTEEANHLRLSIDTLKKEEKALLKTKKQIDAIFDSIASSSNKLVINGNLVKGLYQRLLNYNAELKNNIVAEKIRSCQLKHDFCELKKQIAEEETLSRQLSTEVNYAGANIEISTIVAMAGTSGAFEGKTMEDYQKEIGELNERYCKLQREWVTLSKEDEELRSNYKKMKFKEIVPKFTLDFEDCQEYPQDPQYCKCDRA